MVLFEAEPEQSYSASIKIFFDRKAEIFNDVILNFPFTKMASETTNQRGAAISTMCAHYDHRIAEWAEYSLKLGFKKIYIFDNSNEKNIDYDSVSPIDPASSSGCDSLFQMSYRRENVHIIPFNYSPFKQQHWNNIQRASLTIGVLALKNLHNHIALIDADEFLFLGDKFNVIDELLTTHSSIQVSSKIITNRHSVPIDNNVLELARYLGEEKFKKVILSSGLISDFEFITTPHKHRTAHLAPEEDLFHYHAWMNDRCSWSPSMPRFDLLYTRKLGIK